MSELQGQLYVFQHTRVPVRLKNKNTNTNYRNNQILKLLRFENVLR